MTIGHPFQNVWPDKVTSERLCLNLVFTDCQNLAINFDLKRAEAAVRGGDKSFHLGSASAQRRQQQHGPVQTAVITMANGQIKFASLLVVWPFLTDGNEIKI